jgi:VanZ family protein
MSLETGEQSSLVSSGVSLSLYNIIGNVFPSNHIDFDTFHLYIRKFAHITEFFIVGVLWFSTFYLFGWNIPFVILLGIMIATIDEGIQLFIEGRGPSLIDLFLFDYPGYLFGLVFSRLLFFHKK